MAKKDLSFYNSEGYADPTAYEGLKPIVEVENKHRILIGTIKSIIKKSGFILLNRIELKHKESGISFK